MLQVHDTRAADLGKPDTIRTPAGRDEPLHRQFQSVLSLGGTAGER